MSSADSGVVLQRGCEMDPNNAIEIRNISKSFIIQVADDSKKNVMGRTKMKKKKNTVLNDLSLDIKKGDVLGILGRNGSGKSTFLSILARIMEPDAGTISRSGKIAAILELGMGFHPDMSGRENIYTKGELYGFSKREMDAKIEKIIDYSGVRKYIDNPVRTYSSGMTGRLAFAIMINVDSDIILVDEVLSVGDSSFSAKAKQHFIEMAESGKTVLIVSHNLSYVEEVCNRAIWIESGKIAMDGDPKDVCAEYQNRINEDPDIILDLAESGVPEAQYKLALMYRDGNHYEKNPVLYERWLQSAADKRSLRAQVMYGDMLMSRGDKEKAKEYYLKAAERGDWEARSKVASLSSSGENDIQKLIDLYERSLVPGNGYMEYRYAELLLKIAWCDLDRKKAFDMFVLSANHGYLDALHQVAIMYRDGIGTSKDYEKMKDCLNQSAGGGLIRSMILLADIYGQGKIFPKDRVLSFEWTLKAAVHGNNDCMYRVAVMYRDGIGTGINQEESDKWFKKYEESILYSFYVLALNYNRTIGIEGLKDIYEKTIGYMNAGTIQQYAFFTDDLDKRKQLIELLELLAESGNQDAINRLGNMYYGGLCVNANYKKALYWFEKGSNYGNIWSLTRSGEMCRDGKGTEKDVFRAIHYFKTATLLGDLRCAENLINLSYLYMDQYHNEYKWALTVLTNHAKTGNVDAINKLGDMYLQGRSVEKNKEIAFYWYSKGADMGNAYSSNKCRNL